MEGTKDTNWKAEDWYSWMTEQLGGYRIQGDGERERERDLSRGRVIVPETGGTGMGTDSSVADT